MDTDSIYLSLADENLSHCIQREKKRYLGKIEGN